MGRKPKNLPKLSDGGVKNCPELLDLDPSLEAENTASTPYEGDLTAPDEVLTRPESVTIWGDERTWPRQIETLDRALQVLTWMWSQPRAYTVPELTLLSQVRFEASRKRRIPAQYYLLLRQLARRWEGKDASMARGMLHPLIAGMPQPEHLTHKPAVLAAAPAREPDVPEDWRAGLPT